MYILFINSGGKCDFFFLNLIIIVIKKNIVQPMGQPDPCGLGWVEFFFISHQPNPCTPLLFVDSYLC